MITSDRKTVFALVLAVMVLVAALPVAARGPVVDRASGTVVQNDVEPQVEDATLDMGQIVRDLNDDSTELDASVDLTFTPASTYPGFYAARDNYNLDASVYPIVGGHQSFYWEELEPNQDEYAWWRIDNFVQQRVAAGKKVAFGILTFNGRANEGQALWPAGNPAMRTPQWVFNLGAQKIICPPGWQQTANFEIPKYWDPIYKAHYADFVADMAAHIESDPFLRDNIEFIQIGIGKFGETQPCDDGDDPYVEAALIADGYSRWSWADMAIDLIEMYVNSFSQVNLVLPNAPTFYNNEEERKLWTNYCIQNGVGIFPAGLFPDLEWVDLRTKAGWDGRGKYDPILNQVETGQPLAGYGPVTVAFEMYSYMTGTASELFWGIAGALHRRADYITMEGNVLYDGNPSIPLTDNIKMMEWASPYLGTTIAQAPSVWTILRESGYGNNAYPQKGNYSFGLTQDDNITGGRTIAVTYRDREHLVNGWNQGDYLVLYNQNVETSQDQAYLLDLRNPDDDPDAGDLPDSYPSRMGYMAKRTNQATGNTRMYFNVDNTYIYAGSNEVMITVYYFDRGTDTWELKYDSASGEKSAGVIAKTGSNRWEKATFHVMDARFLGLLSGLSDFYIDCKSDGDEIIHMVDVSSGGAGTESYQVSLTTSNGGWNLISVPLQPTSTAPADFLSSISASYDLAQAYVSGAWQNYSNDGNAGNDSLAAITEKMGVWVHVTQPCTLSVTGQVPDTTTLHLTTGWNMMSWPADDARSLTTALAGISGNVQSVYAHNATDTTDAWKIYDPTLPVYTNDLTQFQPGKGYWIKVSANCDLVVAY